MRKLPTMQMGDLLGGVTSGLVALPLALAFAVASGVPPQAGLYTAIVAGIVASLAGGAPLQITGPTGAMAVILVGLVQQYGIERVWVAGLLAGAIQLGLGLARLGRVVEVLPLPVITGFTAGIGMIIAAGQVGNALGLPAGASLRWCLAHLGQANPHAVALALGVIAVKLAWPRVTRVVPGSLVALVLATWLAAGWDVPRIGAIPRGLPWPALPPLDWAGLPGLLHPAIALASLGAIESLLSATVADRLAGGPRHDPDRELVGQGLANLAVPFFGGIPCTGAIARTAVNIRAGARTRWSGVVHGVFLACVTLFFAPLAAMVPLAALAGILAVVAMRMIEWEQVRLVARATRSDLAVLVLTWAATVCFDLVTAVELGLAAAALFFLRRMADVHVTDSSPRPDVAVLDIDRPLFFGDAHRLEALVLADRHRALVMRLRMAPTMDVTAAVVLRDLHHELAGRGVQLALCDVSEPVLGLLRRVGLAEPCVFGSAEEALAALAA